MISNCDLHVYVRDALNLTEDASNEALVEAVNTLYAQYRDLKDELGVPYWTDHSEVVDEIRSLASSRHQTSHNRAQREWDELAQFLGLSPGASQDEVLARIRADRQALVRAGVLHVELCEVLGLDPEASDQQVVDKVQDLKNLLHSAEKDQASWRQKACHLQKVVDKASVLRVDICEALELDLDEPDQRVVSKVVGLRNLLRDMEKGRDFWRQEAARLRGVIYRAKEALDD